MTKYNYGETQDYLLNTIGMKEKEIIRQQENDEIWETIDKYFIQLDNDNYDDEYVLREELEGAQNESNK